jgi:hypothetical protein
MAVLERVEQTSALRSRRRHSVLLPVWRRLTRAHGGVLRLEAAKSCAGGRDSSAAAVAKGAMITVIDYRRRDREIHRPSIAIACTSGLSLQAGRLPMIFRRSYGTGQFVIDLPVSTEISVREARASGACPSTRRVSTSRFRKDCEQPLGS